MASTSSFNINQNNNKDNENSSWQPNLGSLNQLKETIRCTQHPDTEVQRQVHKALQSFGTIPEYNRYLMFIFTTLHNEPEYVRTFAGIALKNNLLKNYSSYQESEVNYLKAAVVRTLGDPSQRVRRTCGMIINAFITVDSITSWPGILEFLGHCLDGPDPLVVSGAFSALEQICEDHTEALDSEKLGRPVSWLLPKFLNFFNRPETELRRQAISCVIKFIEFYPKEMSLYRDHFIQGYFRLASDPEILIRRQALTAFLILEECHINELKPYLPYVIKLFLESMQHENEDLALDATDFWKYLVENDNDVCKDVVKPLLPQIFPVLLSKMVYSQQDLLDLGFDADISVPDSAKDIVPHYVMSNELKGQSGKGKSGAGEGDSNAGEDEGEYDYGSHWNIRKGSGEAVECLSLKFKGDVLPSFLGHIDQGIKNPNWLTRESCIFGLGCISRGCSEQMEPYLPALIPFLFSMFSDTSPLIRSILCWTLSRYSRWIFKQEDKSYFNRLIQELLEKTQDRNKRVQKYAVTAIASVVENCQTKKILPYMDAISNSFNIALKTYQQRNLVVLYDAINKLSFCLGSHLCKYEVLLLEPILQKWQSLKDTDPELFPVLECISNIALAFGSNFDRFVHPIFERSLRLMEGVLVGTARHNQDNRVDLPNKEFLICNVDLLSRFCVALKEKMQLLIGNSKLMPLLCEACKEVESDYAKSCFALVGDLAKCAYPCVAPHVTVLIPLLIRGIDMNESAPVNNAIWALGEIISSTPPDVLYPHAQKIFDKVLDVMIDNGTEENVLDNCGTTVARLGGIFPDIVVPQLNRIGYLICRSLVYYEDGREKEEAARGLCVVIQRNPTGILKDFEGLCNLIASFYEPSKELKQLFYNLLHAFKNQFEPDLWQRMIDPYSKKTKAVLRNTYNV